MGATGILTSLAGIGGAAFWAALLAKMLASAAIVVLASLAVERAGPLVGAMIATLPLRRPLKPNPLPRPITASPIARAGGPPAQACGCAIPRPDQPPGSPGRA